MTRGLLVALFLSSTALASEPARVDTARLKELVGRYDGKSVREMGPAVLPELVRMYESSNDDEKEKIAAVLYQLRWKSPEAKRALMKDIHTQHQALRLHVQYALGSVSDDVDVVDALLDNMENDSSPLFRDKAACALAYDQVHLIPRQKIHLFERLIGALSNPKLQVRQIALQALQIHTGQTRGFVPSAPEAERARQIESWRRWLEDYRSNL